MPFPIRTANAYLLRGQPLTLIDAGARTTESLAALERALAAERLRIEDIELLVLTHHHIDHVGLAQIVRERSGCEIAAHRRAAAVLRDLVGAWAAEDASTIELLLLHDAPEEAVDEVPSIRRMAARFCESVEVGRELEDGDILVAGGRNLDVRLRTGHSSSDTLFIDREGWAIVGDHVLAAGASIALADEAGEGADAQRRAGSLAGYRASLAATAADALTLALPGHGEPLSDPATTIAERLSAQDRLAERLLGMLADGPRTAWDLVGEIRGYRAVHSESHPISMPFVVLLNLLGHLGLLVSRGRAREVDGRPPLFEAL